MKRLEEWLRGYVYWLSSDLKPDLSLFGGKVLGVLQLLRIKHIGFDVPEGFVISSDAYDEILRLEAKNIKKDLEQSSSRGVEKTAQRIQGRILTERLIKPYDFASDEVAPMYDRLCEIAGIPNVGVAVRSSATHEDLRTKSYAGSYESYLNVRGLGPIVKSMLKCWTFVWKKHLLGDWARIGPDKVKIAVLVQKMICADAAGVVFTADPLSGDPSKICINSNWGLGDSVVSGRVSADIFCIDKDSRELEQIIGEKTVASRCRSDGGTSLEHLPPGMIYSASLTKDNALRLAHVCLEVEKEAGLPVDIEWAFKGGRIYLLQVRPITTL